MTINKAAALRAVRAGKPIPGTALKFGLKRWALWNWCVTAGIPVPPRKPRGPLSRWRAVLRLAREIGVSATARKLGVSRQAVAALRKQHGESFT